MIDPNPYIFPGYTSNNSQYQNYSRFDYYSGSQISVWFGSILIDDVVSIQWNRSQGKRPIYGYASQQFDAVANGTVLIQGSFVINFRQVGFMSVVVNQINNIYSNVTNKNNWPEVKKMIGLHLKNGTFGPKTAEEIIDIGNSDDFLTLSKAYEDIVWGEGVPEGTGSEVPGLKDDTISVVPVDVVQGEKFPDGFTIVITYGNNSGNQAKTLNDYMQSTVKTLTGVHLIGESQAIQVGGQPVLEQYDFIARGTDESLSSLR